jgi:hypothetical protein
LEGLTTFQIELLPAQRGDCLWITYGEAPALHHVIIDGGPIETAKDLLPELERRIRQLPGRKDKVELLVASHVDVDHIQGVVSLISDSGRVPLFRDVWFNGFQHLPAPETLGAPDGERVTRVLSHHSERWNRAFDGGPVAVPTDGPLVTTTLRGGLKLTLLSPTQDGLKRLAPKWARDCDRAGLIPGHGAEIPRTRKRDDILGWNIDLLATDPYKRDRTEANGSSIAFIAEYRGKTLLCLADAHAEVIEASLDRLGDAPHTFTAVKASHHGSRANLSPGLAQRVRSRNWLISTNGAKFGHPSPEALARIITTQRRPVFHLNYVTPYVRDLVRGAGERYAVRLPRRDRTGTPGSGLLVAIR